MISLILLLTHCYIVIFKTFCILYLPSLECHYLLKWVLFWSGADKRCLWLILFKTQVPPLSIAPHNPTRIPYPTYEAKQLQLKEFHKLMKWLCFRMNIQKY